MLSGLQVAQDFLQSHRLAVLLRAGALPAQMTFLEERTIGPELGQDSINAGALATVVATVLVACCLIPAAFLPRKKVAPVDPTVMMGH